MKEFIEKLIARLEERKKAWTAKGIVFSHAGGTEIVDEMAFGIGNGLHEAIEIVNQLAEEHKGGWIPCSERLPEVEADVLLSLRSLDVYTGFRANTEGCFYVEGEGYVEFENVLAWQPLPAPYE